MSRAFQSKRSSRTFHSPQLSKMISLCRLMMSSSPQSTARESTRDNKDYRRKQRTPEPKSKENRGPLGRTRHLTVYSSRTSLWTTLTLSQSKKMANTRRLTLKSKSFVPATASSLKRSKRFTTCAFSSKKCQRTSTNTKWRKGLTFNLATTRSINRPNKRSNFCNTA